MKILNLFAPLSPTESTSDMGFPAAPLLEAALSKALLHPNIVSGWVACCAQRGLLRLHLLSDECASGSLPAQSAPHYPPSPAAHNHIAWLCRCPPMHGASARA